ncbi:MAG: glycosyltransferase family 9 protein [Ignavibacterium sp.]|nr:glycosyltransferase family 9 protein [Ignavibacterium sp.]
MKFLILALSGIGDALMFTPALHLLRKAHPAAQIDVLVMLNGAKDIFGDNPDVNNVIFFDFIKEGTTNSLNFVLSLRKKYDATINVYPSNRKEYNLINFLLGAKNKAAVTYLRANKSNFGWLNNITIKENDDLHNVEENIKLVETLLDQQFNEQPKLQLHTSKKNNLFAENYLFEKNITASDIIVGFHAGCATLKNHIKRRWEPEKFAKLGKRLIDHHKAKVFLFGGPDEDVLKENIRNQIRSDKVIVIKTPDLMKSAAIMRRCNVFVTNDSSLMHISSALGLKVVAIIGPTNIKYIRPWKTEHKIVTLNLDCAPCFFYSPKPLTCSRQDVQFKCIKELDVDLVYKATQNFL